MPRSPKQIEQLKKEKKTQILEASLRVFSSNGFKGATISMIAEEAGISKGLLYTYFKDKENLLDELIVYGLERMTMFMDFVPEKGIQTKGDFEKVLRGLLGLYHEEEDFWRLFSMLILQQNIAHKLQAHLQVFMEQYLGVFMGYFQQKNSSDPFGEAMLLGAILDGMLFDILVAPEVYPVDKVIDMILIKFG
ncbi:MAG: TetR family transcriptional regulator [Bacteroidetes bacterium]|nr:TetR family transcriptional regulator [Bacteroidota bacterium]